MTPDRLLCLPGQEVPFWLRPVMPGRMGSINSAAKSSQVAEDSSVTPCPGTPRLESRKIDECRRQKKPMAVQAGVKQELDRMVL
ncbi:uncharacterized protein LOC144773009 isoform X2 [Lissotriton helveticus]